MIKATIPATERAEPPARVRLADVLADGLLTVADAATFLALSRSTLYEAMERGELVYVKLGRARRIPRRALLAWAEAGLTGGWSMQPHKGYGCDSQTAERQEVAEPCCQSVASGTSADSNGHRHATAEG
jgi:excisionase family DNA binding protein